jgi:dolichol-phosphate mannosyltransferase
MNRTAGEIDSVSSTGIAASSAGDVSGAARRDRKVALDIIIPVYNEEDVLDLLFERLETIFSPSKREKHLISAVNYLIVDDGSKDRSAAIICERIKRGTPAVLYRLSRNYGHQNAVSAGLHKSRSDVVAIIDADMQDPPEVILEMLAKWREDYDVVYGIRTNRKENVVKISAYRIFYLLISFLSEIDIPLDSGDFSLLDRRVVRAMKGLPEKLRFPRVLRAWVGFRQVGLSYDRSSRAAGTSKYSFSKLYKLATDGIAAASIRPLKIAQVFCIVYLAFITILAAVLLGKYWSYRGVNEFALWALFGYLLIALGSFVQTLCVYILGAYVGRTYLEVKDRPSYVVMEVIGGKASGSDHHHAE